MFELSPMIIKVQRPIASSDPACLWLLYDEERKHIAQIPDKYIPPEVKRAMGEDFIAFFSAYFLGDVLVIDERVGERHW